MSKDIKLTLTKINKCCRCSLLVHVNRWNLILKSYQIISSGLLKLFVFYIQLCGAEGKRFHAGVKTHCIVSAI